MDEVTMRDRLAVCFHVVFPQLPTDEITRADQSTLDAWDSVAGITLVSVVEDEFRVTMDLERLPELTSFSAVLDYLRELQAVA